MTADPSTVPAAVDPSATLEFRVIGTPAPQGSFFAILVRGRPQVVADSKATKPWRVEVGRAAANAVRARGGWLPVNEATEVTVWFWLPRGSSVRRVLPFVRPDVDKLARSTLDALTACGVLVDDARVTDLVVRKRYADGEIAPGARVRVRPVDAVLL